MGTGVSVASRRDGLGRGIHLTVAVLHAEYPVVDSHTIFSLPTAQLGASRVQFKKGSLSGPWSARAVEVRSVPLS